MTSEELKVYIDTKLLKLRREVDIDIRDALVEVQSLAEKIIGIENSVSNTLTKHELQRTNFNESIERKIDTLAKWFEDRDKHEMGKYNEIIEMLKNLKQNTDENSDYISRKAHEEKLEEEVALRIAEQKAPMKAVWNKFWMAFVGALGIAAAGAIWVGIKFIMDLSKLVGADNGQ